MRRPQLRPRPPAKRSAEPQAVPSSLRPVPKSRILHAVIPADAHRQARIAAAASDLRFKEFLTVLLRKAQPIQRTREP